MTEKIEHATTVRSSIDQESKPESRDREEFHPLFMKEFSTYLSLLEDKPEQGAQLATPAEDVEVAAEACTEAAQPEELENPSQTSDQPEIPAVPVHVEEEPQQPQPHQQTEESFEILTWVKEVAGDHFVLKENEAEELAKFMTQLRPGKISPQTYGEHGTCDKESKDEKTEGSESQVSEQEGDKPEEVRDRRK